MMGRSDERTWVLSEQTWGTASRHPRTVLVVSRGTSDVADSEGPALYSPAHAEQFIKELRAAVASLWGQNES